MAHLTALPHSDVFAVCRSYDSFRCATVYHVPELEVVRCKGCGLRFIDSETDIKPRLKQLELEEHHVRLEAMYRQKVQKDFEQLHAIWRTTARSPDEDARLLDVGCGIGIFVEEVRRHGWLAWAVEMNRLQRNMRANKAIITS